MSLVRSDGNDIYLGENWTVVPRRATFPSPSFLSPSLSLSLSFFDRVERFAPIVEKTEHGFHIRLNGVAHGIMDFSYEVAHFKHFLSGFRAISWPVERKDQRSGNRVV